MNRPYLDLIGMSEPTNILLVDDQARNLDSLEAILTSPDYQLFRAQSANEALLALLAHDFAVIVLDIRMPEVSGLRAGAVDQAAQKKPASADHFLDRLFAG